MNCVVKKVACSAMSENRCSNNKKEYVIIEKSRIGIVYTLFLLRTLNLWWRFDTFRRRLIDWLKYHWYHISLYASLRVSTRLYMSLRVCRSHLSFGVLLSCWVVLYDCLGAAACTLPGDTLPTVGKPLHAAGVPSVVFWYIVFGYQTLCIILT